MFNKLPETKPNCTDCKNHGKTGQKCLHMIHMNRLLKDTKPFYKDLLSIGFALGNHNNTYYYFCSQPEKPKEAKPQCQK